MTESRQQRRARERAELKASRPGLSARPTRVVEVVLRRGVDDSDPDDPYISWGAEWAVRDSSEGVEDQEEDLAVLVQHIVEDLQAMAQRYTVRLEWTLEGDPSEGMTIAEAVAAAGVTLPRTV
ncbi:hypothetical protein QRX50_35030 [Amycolatopsis carbonis]|uniref:Uncharacterized protein n=1 Tax=Amycolatopsis carbonis TaxID=715471 RepID=A0A9Y2ICV0_9PSEU|nr:hypothetical protein [Amycolatopsis sp. 2-15]WIX76641.1 hypothetical protein QRX50_35030 [Amycolatopsis sp. 2-15]